MLRSVQGTIAVTVIDLSLATVLVSLRFATRIFLVRKLWPDDWFALLSLVMLLASNAFYLDGLFNRGFGQGSTTESSSNTVLGVRDFIMYTLLYLVGTGLIKVSFGITLLRLVRPRICVVVLKITIFAVSALTIIIFFLVLFSCSPVRYAWEQAADPYRLALEHGANPASQGLKPLGSCRPPIESVICSNIHACMMIVTDVTLGVILPIMVLKDLNMRIGLKISAGVLLALGALPSIASIIRLVYTHTLHSNNMLLAVAPFLFWSNVEFGWCLITTSVSTLKPLAIKLSLIKDTSSKQYSNTYGADKSNLSARIHSMARRRATDDIETRVWAGLESHDSHPLVEVIGATDKDASQAEEFTIVEAPTTRFGGINKTVEVSTTMVEQ